MEAMKNLLLPLILLAVAPGAQGQTQGQALTIPFHTANNLILLDVSVDGKSATLALDTGATYTYLVPRFSPGWKAEVARASTHGMYYATDIKLEIAGQRWFQWHVLVDDVAEKVHVHI